MCFSQCLAPKFNAVFHQWRDCIAEKFSYSQVSRMFGFSSFPYVTFVKSQISNIFTVYPGVFIKRIILLGIAGCKNPYNLLGATRLIGYPACPPGSFGNNDGDGNENVISKHSHCCNDCTTILSFLTDKSVAVPQE